MPDDRSRRLAAGLSLALAAVAAVLAVAVAIASFPNGLFALASLAGAVVIGWAALPLSRGVRTAGLVASLALVVTAVALLVADGNVVAVVVIAIAAFLSFGSAARAFRVRAALPAAPRPQRAVLFYNPKSGG